jgi:ferrochelatase
MTSNAKRVGILLTNTGTPDAPTPDALKRYLGEFLSDPRIVNLPRLLWLPLLFGLILPIRAKRSAKLYQNIWTTDSPLRITMQHIRQKLSETLKLPVAIGMHYGKPTIPAGLLALQNQGVEMVHVLPLFPQFSYATTATTFDQVVRACLQQTKHALEIVPHYTYAHHPLYIEALAQSVRAHWQQHGRGDHFLLSFHGIPEQAIKKGDPYALQCELTTRLLTEKLELPNTAWTLCYQSRFGFAKWQSPATFDVLADLPKQGIKTVDVICPGFAVDCLETLEEIALRGRDCFHEAGGKAFRYIPALNATEAHIALLQQLT